MPMPSLFLAHNDPSLKLIERKSRYTEFLIHLVSKIPRPKAIAIVSAYWDHPVQQITGALELESLYEPRGGFLTVPEVSDHSSYYPAKGDILLSLDIQNRFAADSIRSEIDDKRGLDPNAWSLLSLMYPQADIPVVALSVNSKLVPEEHYRTGQALQGLREKGVLIVGAGGNYLPLAGSISMEQDQTRSKRKAMAFKLDDWIEDQVAIWDLEALFDYDRRAPLISSLKPNLGPLLVCMGAGEANRKGRRIFKGYTSGGISISGWIFG